MMDWQTIDTAPKDGTEIVVWTPKEPQKITTVRWRGAYWLGGPYNNRQEYPTHWMPLQPPA